MLGGARFAEEARKRMKISRESPRQRPLRRRREWAEIVAAVEKSRGEPWGAFAPRHADLDLALTLHVARRCTGLTLRELGEAAGGMDYAAVAAAISRFGIKLAEGRALQVQIKAILNRIEKLQVKP